MNKIVIVGHPQSGYQEVENLLNACGMAAAQPSRREGFMPDQISNTLCKVHATPQLTELACADHIQQIEAGPVWHGMALDLMLGNLEQPLWGWADPQTIYLLNYWRDLDPSITFILVYDRPHSMLTQASADAAVGLSAEALAGRARNWAAYNAAMLHFYLRNPQRCLLVHSQQVRESASSYLQQVRARINAPWSERMQELAALEAPQDLEDTPSELIDDQAPAQDSLQAALITDPEATHHNPAAPPPNALALFLADALLRQHPASLQLYQELQAVANLPLAGGTDVVLHEHSALDAWLAMAVDQQRLSQTEALVQQKQQLIERVSQARDQAEQLAHEHLCVIAEQARQAQQEQARLTAAQALADQRAAQLSQQAEQLKQQLAEKEQLAQTHAAQASMSQAEKLASEQENELLLAQLHQVQEELERHYIEGQRQKEAIKALQATEKLAAERAKDIAQLSQEKTKLIGEKDTQAKLAAERATQNEQLKKQLATQTQAVAQETQKAQAAAAAAKASTSAAAKQAEERAAQVQQLTQAKAAADKLADERKQQLDQLQAQLQAVQAQAAAAPVVDPALEQENELLLSQLHQVQEELERYYLERQAQKQQLAKLSQVEQRDATHQQELDRLQAELQALKAAPPAPALGALNEQLLTQLFQAQEEQERRFHGKNLAAPALGDLTPADRVRQQLSYRLGSTMIENSRSFKGMLSLPVALIKTTRQYRRDLAARAGHPPPAPGNMHDKQMADAVKQHLSYKLGATLIAHSRSPIGWVKMPFALRREVKEFRKSKRG